MSIEKRRPGRPKVENKRLPYSFNIEAEKMDMFDALAVMNEQSRSERLRGLIVWDIEQQTGLQEQEQ